MAIIEKTKYLHWNYFLAIESDTETLSRYIEFTKNNYKTYSIEIARLLLSAASEIDVIAKLLCIKVNPSCNAENINEYRKILNPSFPKMKEMKILIRRYGLELNPWSNWKRNKNPFWWTAYNKVKHERNMYYQEANLKNTLNTIAGLFVMLLYLYKDEAEAGTLGPSPSLFRVEKKFDAGVDASSGDLNLVYRL